MTENLNESNASAVPGDDLAEDLPLFTITLLHSQEIRNFLPHNPSLRSSFTHLAEDLPLFTITLLLSQEIRNFLPHNPSLRPPFTHLQQKVAPRGPSVHPVLPAHCPTALDRPILRGYKLNY